MAQLLISCFSVVLLCVTWTATSAGEDVLDNLGVEAHPFQEEGPSQDDFTQGNSTGNKTDERDVQDVVAGDSPFSLHNTDGRVDDDFPANEVGSQNDGEKVQESAAQSRSDGEDAKDVLDTLALGDDVGEDAEVDEPKGNKTDGEGGKLNATQSSAGAQGDSLDLFKPNITSSSKKLDEQANEEVSSHKADEQTVTKSSPHGNKDILDLLDMDDFPEVISNDESETELKQPETSELDPSVENAYNLLDKDKEGQKNISEFVDRSSLIPADTTQTDYNKYFYKSDGEGRDQEKDYEDSNTESEDLNEDYADYFSDDDEDDDSDDDYEGGNSINLGDNDDEKNNNHADDSAEQKTKSLTEDGKLAAFVSSHLSEIPSNTTSNRQAEDEEEDNISKGSEENDDKGQDTDGNIPQTEDQKEDKGNENDDDDDDEEEDDYHRIPDYGAGGNYEEDDWYYDPLRNGAHTDRTTQETPNDIDQKTGVSPHVSMAETNEGGLASHDIQPKKQLAGPTGMILLYTALIVLFIAGIVVITVWKQPFHGWLRTRVLPSKGVLPADEGKRLLDHPFV